MAEATQSHNLCVLMDFENLAAGVTKEGHGRFDIRTVMRRLKDKGRILVARSYGDWGRFAKYKQSMLEQGVNMMELTSYRGQEKNRADIALVVDAMELAYTRDYLDTFVLFTGDSDFTPLVQRLKELNKRVIGIGNRMSSSRLLIEGCDEFIFYETLVKGAREERVNPSASAGSAPSTRSDQLTSLSREQAFSLLSETMEGLHKESTGPVLAGLIKQSMQRKEPAFDENEYGYKGFARFLEAARDKEIVSLHKDERAGGYRVDMPGENVETPTDEAAEVDLPTLDGEAGRLQQILAEAGFHPLSHLMRHTVVHEFVDHVQERVARKKRNTLMYVYGDIARRCRKTDPFVAPRNVRTVISALREAGNLLHPDGDPVRAATAPFTINQDAEELLEALRRFYIGMLFDRGETLDSPKEVSRLLWEDARHTVAAKKLIGAGRERQNARQAASEPSEATTEE
jgi:uncharacterized protein (TIGR00288 family)